LGLAASILCHTVLLLHCVLCNSFTVMHSLQTTGNAVLCASNNSHGLPRPCWVGSCSAHGALFPATHNKCDQHTLRTPWITSGSPQTDADRLTIVVSQICCYRPILGPPQAASLLAAGDATRRLSRNSDVVKRMHRCALMYMDQLLPAAAMAALCACATAPLRASI
jgi:hypothetical protein